MKRPHKRTEIATTNTASINRVYGELGEDLHFTGYAFERGCHRLRKLLSDDSWKQCGGGFSNVDDFLNSLQLDQFAKVTEERRELAKLIKELRPEVSTRAIERALKVGEGTVRKNSAAEAKKPNQNNAGVRKNSAKSVGGAAAAKLVVRREERMERDAEAAAKLPTVTGTGSMVCHKGDFRSALAGLKDIDAIITDPPYEQKALPLLRDLGQLANTILKPDGVMVILYGQTFLPEAMAMLTGFRPYRWMGCYLTEGNGYVSHARKVQSNWKPLLIYGGGPRFGDLFRSAGDGAAKEVHDWGQNFETFKQIIEAFTEPNAKVVDPFAGGGTTLLAAKAAGRHAIGCEIDEKCEVFKFPKQEAAE
jgi:16S rRNA G966 N2-methylase RsmD